jgi:hypothetical protein
MVDMPDEEADLDREVRRLNEVVEDLQLAGNQLSYLAGLAAAGKRVGTAEFHMACIHWGNALERHGLERP